MGKIQKITIKTRLGDMKVKAEVLGHFAVHDSADKDGTLTVTHVPTGFSFPMALRRRSFALAFIGLLNKQATDWSTTVPEEIVSRFMELSK